MLQHRGGEDEEEKAKILGEGAAVIKEDKKWSLVPKKAREGRFPERE